MLSGDGARAPDAHEATNALRTPFGRLLEWMTAGTQARYSRTRSLYLRALGVVYFVAFASWYSQQDGLVGSRGILPAAELVNRLHASAGVTVWDAPTLLWWGAGDGALAAVAVGGMVASTLLVLGLVPLVALMSCWLLYLSLSVVGGVFMHFQWDALLLEAGVMSLCLCPLALRLGARNPEPHPLAIFLVRWLLFRLMLLSGWVKLASHDETWRDLSALAWHYWTQPLPTWSAWIIDGLPRFAHQGSAVAMFAVELLAPLFVLAPRRLRLYLAFGPIVGLMLVIAATGNYGFFNLLALALCIPLLDDAALRSWTSSLASLRRREGTGAPPEPPRRVTGGPALLRGAVIAAVCALVLAISIGEIEVRMLQAELPPWQERLIDRARPFRSVSTYGLFATMTTDRLEIGLEGSDDGRRWRPYRFKWKPGPLDARPQFVTPHMPRLDWQMWFAALGNCQQNPWFVRFQQRLLEGSPSVAALLADNPFPDHPPRYLRTPLSRYRFSDLHRWRKDGSFWTRESVGDYCPALTLQDGRVQRAEVPR